jgi:LysM repeat protein
MKYSSLIALSALLSALLLAQANLASAQQSPRKQASFRTYTVKKGDTCTSIAREFYGDARAYNHIHEHNDLSEDGYACRPGQKLRLPILPDQAEAKLTARAGNVRAKPPTSAWDPVDVGAEFFKAWRVNTLQRSRAELGFRDNSQLQMTENTLVVIYGPSRETAKRTVARRATVEKGRLKTRLADLSGSRVEVDTPDAKATFDAGRAQVTVDDGESRIANHTGKPVTVTSAKGKGKVSVTAGHGTRVRRGKPPEKPRPLPATPTWTKNFEPQALAIPGSRATVRAEWNPVSKAKAYYVEVSRGRRQIDVLFSKRVPAKIRNLEMRGLPPGEYFVSIVAIDADEFESIPSKLRRLRIHELGAEATQILEANDGQVMLGATLRAPKGLRCATKGAEPAEVFELTTEGTHEVACSGEGVELTTELEAVRPTITARDGLTMRQGALGAVEVAFEPALPEGVTAQVSGEGLQAKPLQVGPGQLRVNLTAANDAQVGPREVALYYRDVLLGSFDVELQQADTVSMQPTEKLQAEYLLTALVGYDAVGADPYWPAAFPTTGATLELGLGTAPTHHFAAEARLGLALHSGDALNTVATARAQVLAGWFQTALAPHAGLGVSWQGVLDGDQRFSPRASLGVMPTIGELWRLRGEVGVDATPVDGALRFLPEARMGVSLRF